MASKTFKSGRLQIKSEATGEVEAVFARMGVWDLDNDWTLPGAFGKQDDVLIEQWNHSYTLPVGKGRVFERGNEAIFQGRFFLETQPGRDHFETVKATMPEWSYSFEVRKFEPATNAGRPGRRLIKMDVLGVSPVTRGAGIDTRTLAVKGRSKVAEWRAQIDELSEGMGGGVWLPIGRQKTTTQLRAELASMQAEAEQIGIMVYEPGELRSRLESELAQSDGIARRRQALDAEGMSPALANAHIGGELQARTDEYLRIYDTQLYWRPDHARRLALRDMSLA